MEEGTAGPAGDFQALYDELRALARMHFDAQPSDHTLQATALVNEAYLKMAAAEGAAVRDRTHFMALASRVMRQVLVDHARARRAAKRGGDRAAERVTLSEVADVVAPGAVDILALEDALQELGQLSEPRARLVELRFYGGLTEAEAAEVLGITRASAAHQWRFVRAWLRRRLAGDGDG